MRTPHTIKFCISHDTLHTERTPKIPKQLYCPDLINSTIYALIDSDICCLWIYNEKQKNEPI